MSSPQERAARMLRGVHLQVYLRTAKFKEADFPGRLDRWKRLGGVGVVLHCPSMKEAEELGTIVAAKGLQLSIAHGLGQWDSLHPESAGERMARFARLPHVVASVVDAETAWRNDPTDREAAAKLGTAFRALCPDALAVGQFVAVLQNRGEEAKRFGRVEFLRWVDAMAPMFYRNYAFKRDPESGKFVTASPENGGQFDPNRADIFPTWRAKQLSLAADLGLPAQPWQSWQTLQGYWWGGITAALVDVLLRAVDGVSLVWAEPWWDASFEAGMIVVRELAARGFVGPEAVSLFQRAAGLTADGIAGPKTRAALGLQ